MKPPKKKNIGSKVEIDINDVLAASREIAKDADACEVLRVKEDTQFARRNWVRAYFAWVEAHCFLLRQFVIYRRFRRRVIKPKEIAEYTALSEIKFIVTPSGEVSSEGANSRTRDYICFSLMACSRLFDLGLSIKPGDVHWENMLKAIKIRDRITHPKSMLSITITDAEIEIIQEFNGWLHGHLEVLFNEKLKRRLRKERGIAKRTKKARTFVHAVDDSPA